MPEKWERLLRPVPILQWLVVLVLVAHFLLSQESPGLSHIVVILSLLSCNVIVLYVLPRLVTMETVVTTLVIADTVLVPSTLYVTGASRMDLLVGYFGVIMIAGAAGTVKRALYLASITCATYAAFTLLTIDDQGELAMILLRIPFLLAMTLIYGALAEFTKEVQRAKEKLAYAAMHDVLTGIPNRRYLLDMLAKQLQESHRFGSPLSCMSMDLDHFKNINDTHGHAMGDLVLQEFSMLLVAHCRGYDLVGRLGGDEIVSVLPRAAPEHAMAAADRFREKVQRYQFGGGEVPLSLTTSIGVTTYLPSEMELITPGEMLKAADKALYRAKEQGKNRVEYQRADGVEGSSSETQSEPVSLESRS